VVIRSPLTVTWSALAAGEAAGLTSGRAVIIAAWVDADDVAAAGVGPVALVGRGLPVGAAWAADDVVAVGSATNASARQPSANRSTADTTCSQIVPSFIVRSSKSCAPPIGGAG
jgi:hypothetical protein